MDDNVTCHHVVVDNDRLVDNIAYHAVVEATNVTSIRNIIVDKIQHNYIQLNQI